MNSLDICVSCVRCLLSDLFPYANVSEILSHLSNNLLIPSLLFLNSPKQTRKKSASESRKAFASVHMPTIEISNFDSQGSPEPPDVK